MSTVTSRDGTAISFDKSGQGEPIILVAAALSYRSDVSKLAGLLAPHFTVINYDRRGRGGSSDTPPYAIEREVEDIEALIKEAGGSAYLFGSSSGAVLALEAASRLGSKVKGLFMYEPPFITDDSRPPVADSLADEIARLVAANRRSDAVWLFFNKAVGIPAVFVTLMRLLMPDWKKSVEIAHTILYDLAVMAGLQSGRPLPAGRWESIKAPVFVATGGKSEAFFHRGAQALAAILPNAQHQSLKDQHHGSVVMDPGVVASTMVEFFKA